MNKKRVRKKNDRASERFIFIRYFRNPNTNSAVFEKGQEYRIVGAVTIVTNNLKLLLSA